MFGEGGTNGGRSGLRDATPWIAIGLTFLLAASSWVQQWSVTSERLASGLTMLHGLQEQASAHEARITLLEERFRVMGQRDDAQDRSLEGNITHVETELAALIRRIDAMDERQRVLESQRVLALDRLDRLEREVSRSDSPDRAPPSGANGFGRQH